MDHHADLAGRQPEQLRSSRVVNFPDDLHLQEMVSRPQAADLAQAPVDSPLADPARLGTGDHALVLTPSQVPPGAMTTLDRVPGPAGQDFLQLGPAAQPPHPTGARAAGYHRRQGVHHRSQPRRQPGPIQVRGQQPHPAGNVEAHPAGGDHPSSRGIGGGHAPDREPIAPVDVRHRI